MIYNIDDNKLILYNVKLNKNYLKAIRKMIISKYGTINTDIHSLNKEEFHMYTSIYYQDVTPIIIKKRYNQNNKLIEIIFYQVKNPTLATTIIKILEEPDKYLQFINEFLNQLEITNYKGTEYLLEIMKCIKLVPIFEYNDMDTENFYQQLINHGFILHKQEELDNHTLKSKIISLTNKE